MNVLSLFFIIAFMIYIYFGFYILLLYKKNKINGPFHKLFFVLCIVFSVWSFNYSFLVSSDSKGNCWLFFKLSLPLLVFFPALLLHYFLILTLKVKNLQLRKFYPLIYIPGIVFIIKGLTGVLTVSDFVKYKHGWGPVYSVVSPWFIAYTVYYIGILSACLILILLWYNKTGSLREKKQARIIFITAFISIVINIVLQNVLPALNIHSVPKIPQIITLIWMFGIWYAMVKYKFMAPTPSLTSHENNLTHQ